MNDDPDDLPWESERRPSASKGSNACINFLLVVGVVIIVLGVVVWGACSRAF